MLETFVRNEAPAEALKAPFYSTVAVCGERLPFDQTVTLPQLHFDFRSEWDEFEFFIAPTQMNCDRDLDGDIVATVERFGRSHRLCEGQARHREAAGGNRGVAVARSACYPRGKVNRAVETGSSQSTLRSSNLGR